MTRRDLLLVALAPAKGAAHSPVQVQKLLFLIDQNIQEIGLAQEPYFNFAPYHYGPFDKAVYEELEELATVGYVYVCPERTWKTYRLTVEGQELGDKLFASLPDKAQDYIQRASDFVRSLTFTQLVSAIYRAYPEMRANSVFQE